MPGGDTFDDNKHIEIQIRNVSTFPMFSNTVLHSVFDYCNGLLILRIVFLNIKLDTNS